jgi:glycosyltransferase involved in cell wall biosynthesis
MPESLIDAKAAHVPLKVAIAHHSTIGLAQDAAVLAAAILMARPHAQIVEWTLPAWCTTNYSTPIPTPEALSSLAPFDYLFLLEHAYSNPPILDRKFARRIVYIPNIEWINSLDEEVLHSGALDAVMLKTKHTVALFGSLPSAANVLGASLYTGWTSADLGHVMAERAQLSFLHVVGSSTQKGTKALMEAWLAKPEYPMLTVTAFVSSPIEIGIPLYASSNLRFHLAPLPTEQLRHLQRQSAVHLCPSIAEGVGHSINEARSAAAVLVTAGAPPMNEFVEDGWNGFLVPVRAENSRSYHLSTAYFATAEDIRGIVEKILTMSKEERVQVGIRARAAYSEDRSSFIRRIGQFLDS